MSAHPDSHAPSAPLDPSDLITGAWLWHEALDALAELGIRPDADSSPQLGGLTAARFSSDPPGEENAVAVVHPPGREPPSGEGSP